MNILNPKAGWFLLALVPVVLFYFLRVRPRKVEVSTLMFWSSASRGRTFRGFWQRIRHLVSLAVSLFLVGLIVFGLMDPILTKHGSNVYVFILDNSQSMATRDGGVQRLEEARRQLIRRVNRLSHSQTGLVVAAVGPELVIGRTGHLGTLREGIRSIRTRPGTAALAEAMTLARDVVPRGVPLRLVLATDNPPRTETEGVDWIPVGRSEENTALLSLAARRLPEDPAVFEVQFKLARFGKEPVSCRATTSLDGRPLDIRSLSLQGGEKSVHRIRARSTEGGVLAVDLDVQDALSEDNHAEIRLSPLRNIRILRFGPDNYFLARALAAIPQASMETIGVLPDEVPEDACLVLYRQVPDHLPRGNVLIVAPENNCDRFTTGDRLDTPLATELDETSPLLTQVQLKSEVMTGARKLVPVTNDPTAVPVRTQEGDPILVVDETPERRLIILAADPDQGDLALRIAFPILMDNIIRFYREDEESEPGTSAYVLPGEEESNLQRDPIPAPEQGEKGLLDLSIDLWTVLIVVLLVLIVLEWHLWHRRCLE